MKKIVDVSYLERPELRDYLQSDKNNFVIFCDYACMESYKGDAIKNIYKSLEIVSDYTEQVLILKGTRDLVKQTLEYDGDETLVDLSQTKGFASFCVDVRKALEGHVAIQKQILEHGKNATSQFNRMHNDSEKIAQGIKGYKKSFKPEYLKIIRTREAFNHEMITKMIDDVMTLTAFLFEGHPDVNQLPEVRQVKNSYTFRYALSSYLLSLDLIANEGIENALLNKLTSDTIDLHYVAYATYFDGLLTLDKKMRRIYNDAVVVLENAFATMPTILN